MTTREVKTGPDGKAETIELLRFETVRDAWRCPHMSSALSGPGEQYFHEGTVMRLDGEAHRQRRRIMGQILARRGHARFREQWLYPTANAALNELLDSAGTGGNARVDLVRWARRVNQQLAAAVTGYDGATSPEGAQRLFDVFEVMLHGRPGAFQIVMGGYDENSPAALAALEAKSEIIEGFHRPALERRRQLLVEVEQGRMAAGDLPNDYLMLAAQKLDPAWEDSGLVERDAIFLLAAAVHTTASALVWSLAEIFEWIEADPSREARLTDESFILRAAQESMRLHPVTPGFPRLATENITLEGGVDVSEGTIAILRSGPANTDVEIWGEDALRFNPDRVVPAGVNRFGLAFGMGQHMCFGMPIVMGTGGLDGSLVYMLKLLLDAGVRPDRERLEPFDLAASRGVTPFGYQSFHVLFPLPKDKEPTEEAAVDG